tara:strand:+ start:1471 stop:1659 length:189 start_codon:yes stop_codon:yes gene_type:complete
LKYKKEKINPKIKKINPIQLELSEFKFPITFPVILIEKRNKAAMRLPIDKVAKNALLSIFLE